MINYFGGSIRRIISMGCASVMLVVSGPALAQTSDYPTSTSRKLGYSHGYGFLGKGAFDAEPGKKQGFADVDEPKIYRVCIVGAHGRLIVDGQSFPMDHGDCHDVSGKSLSFMNDSKDVETHGSYEMLDLTGQ